MHDIAGKIVLHAACIAVLICSSIQMVHADERNNKVGMRMTKIMAFIVVVVPASS